MIKFGPSGNSEAFYNAGKKTSEQSAVWVKEMGLDCFEYSFGRGVSLTDERAIEIGKAFNAQGIEISVHAPYYINFANPSEEMIKNSNRYLLDSVLKGKLMGAKRVVFHPASQGKMAREEAVSLTKKRIKEFVSILEDSGVLGVNIYPETMGKLGQIGTVEEIAEFCTLSDRLIPTIDFGHVNARGLGSLKTEEDYYKILRYMISTLGYEKMKNFHVHFSKIEYGAKGEIKHLTFDDQTFGPDYNPFITVIKDLKLEPYVISESNGTQDIDALTLKNAYYGNKNN
jgi:deoxyribonuclease-4